jgi:hypothetical protein
VIQEAIIAIVPEVFPRYVAKFAVRAVPEKLVALTVALTVAFPIVNPDVVKLTFAPTLTTVAILAVAGRREVARVPDEILVELAANAVALEYVVASSVVA